MSESSSPTSSQLDDIELAEPLAKTYEHQTNVGLLFSGDPQQCSPRIGMMPARDRVAAGEAQEEYAMLRTPRGGEVPRESARLERCRSGASPDGMQQRRHAASTHAPRRLDSWSAVMEPRAGGGTVTVDVLSPAFLLNEHAWQQGHRLGRGPAEIIAQRSCTGLGVDAGSLRYFELREVSAGEIDVRACGHYAVAIDRAGFTLQDMEEALAERSRLQDTTQKSTAALEAMQDLVRDFDADRSKLHLQTAEYREEIRRLEQRCQELEMQGAMLSQRLTRSDQQRLEGQQKIQQLRHEFMDVQARMPQRRTGSAAGPLTSRRAHHHQGQPVAAAGVTQQSQHPPAQRVS